MDLLGAYSVGSFELRVLTYGLHVSPSEQDGIDEACLSCFTEHSAEWLTLAHGFHSCSAYQDGLLQVCEKIISFVYYRSYDCMTFCNSCHNLLCLGYTCFKALV